MQHLICCIISQKYLDQRKNHHPESFVSESSCKKLKDNEIVSINKLFSTAVALLRFALTTGLQKEAAAGKKQSIQNFLQATKNQGVDGINELQTEQIRKGKTVKSIPTEALKNARK